MHNILLIFLYFRFDKPKNYLIYMPYNNLHTLVKEGIGL